MLLIVRSRIVDHLVDATVLQRFLASMSETSPRCKSSGLTVMHVLYWRKSGSHSSFFAVPLKYSGSVRSRQHQVSV
jgi:hypothetical protein